MLPIRHDADILWGDGSFWKEERKITHRGDLGKKLHPSQEVKTTAE